MRLRKILFAVAEVRGQLSVKLKSYKNIPALESITQDFLQVRLGTFLSYGSSRLLVSLFSTPILIDPLHHGFGRAQAAFDESLKVGVGLAADMDISTHQYQQSKQYVTQKVLTVE